MEGPSLVILKKEVAFLKGKRVISASGNTSIKKEILQNETIKDFKTWGKHFLIVFKDFSIRIHFLMFGRYRINERKAATPRLQLKFDDVELNFYSCAITLLEGDVKKIYDWSVDVMSRSWDGAKARRKLKKLSGTTVGDALLDQSIFASVGNIIKNEVLFRVFVHPESKVDALPPRKLTSLVQSVRDYCFDFYRWKKKYQLRKHWLIYTKRICPRCNLPIIKKPTGLTLRRSFFCNNCQVLYVKKIGASKN